MKKHFKPGPATFASLLILTVLSVSRAAIINVSIQGFAFVPDSVHVQPGDTVRWTNETQVTHTSTGNGETWNSGNLGNGQSYQRVFDDAGAFTYFCTPHPFMTGAVTVGDAVSIEDTLYTPRAELIVAGGNVYSSNCTGCHGSEGRGIAGSVPPHANSDFVMADRLRLVDVLLNGLEDPITVNGMEYDGSMPNFDYLSNFEIAAVLTYIRAALNDSLVVSCDPETFDDDGFAVCVKSPRDPGDIAADSIAVWEVRNARIQPPENLAYSANPAAYTAGMAITPNTASVTGTVDSFTVASPLPADLSLNAATGEITGTPAEASPSTVYIVRAHNVSGHAEVSLTITVDSATPPITTPGAPTNVTAVRSDGEVTVSWSAPADDGGSAITSYTVHTVPDTSRNCAWTSGPLSCTVTGLEDQTEYTFTVTATNAAGTGPPSSPPLSPIPGPPLDLAYAPDSAVFLKDSAVAAWTPAVTGMISSWAIDPPLPAGLAFNVVSGTISGTPTTAIPLMSYTVTASNVAGEATTVVKIGVLEPVSIRPEAFVFRIHGRADPYTFRIPRGAAATTEQLTLSIADMWGRTVWTRTVSPKDGPGEITWNGRTTTGRPAAAGMYVVRVSARNQGETSRYVRKTVTLKPK